MCVGQQRLMALKFLVIFLFLLSQVEGYHTDCIFHKYTNAPGEVIAKFQPTLPGKISLQFGDKSLSIYSRIVSLVPEVGTALSALYGTIADLTDNTVDNIRKLQKTINDLIDDVRKTIMDLKNYVDAKFDQYDYDKKSEALKGIYGHSGLCADFSSPDNKVTCLKNLVLNMVGLYSTFLPADPKYETFEQLLPMTRQFADLHFAALLDILGLTELDKDYKSALAKFSVSVYNYFVHGINSIVDQHLKNVGGVSCSDIGEKRLCVAICYTPPCGCTCTEIGAYVCQQKWGKDDGCKAQHPNPADPSEGNCFFAALFWPSKAKSKLKGKLGTYKKDLESAIRKYWGADVGQTMESWKKLGLKAGACKSAFLPYSANATTSTQGEGYDKGPIAKFIDELIHAIANGLKQKAEGKSTEGTLELSC